MEFSYVLRSLSPPTMTPHFSAAAPLSPSKQCPLPCFHFTCIPQPSFSLFTYLHYEELLSLMVPFLVFHTNAQKSKSTFCILKQNKTKVPYLLNLLSSILIFLSWAEYELSPIGLSVHGLINSLWHGFVFLEAQEARPSW